MVSQLLQEAALLGCASDDRRGQLGVNGEMRISFTWKNQGSSQKVHLTKRGTNDGHPPNWEDWERNG